MLETDLTIPDQSKSTQYKTISLCKPTVILTSTLHTYCTNISIIENNSDFSTDYNVDTRNRRSTFRTNNCIKGIFINEIKLVINHVMVVNTQ